jgi:predicted alpha/beta superfamily hydrolase
MKLIRKIFFLPIVLLISVSANTQPVKIPNSETKKITSSIVSGQQYELQILLPGNYSTTGKKYPVVYLMDSQWDFPLLAALYGEQYYDGFIPAVIIVGVTWGGEHPNPDSLRVRDYTPTNDGMQKQSGGADKFLSFMKEELFPFIEKNYKVDANSRTLMGSSLGGLISMYALFSHPEMFTGYVAASPAFGWGNNVLNQYEEKYFANKNNPPARLFMCVGGVERSVGSFQILSERLSSRNYSNLKIDSRVLENTGHSGTKGEGFARGLQFVFQRPSLQLSAEELKKFEGSYKSSTGNIVLLRSENGRLAILQGGNNKYFLNAASKNDFYSTSEFLNIHFIGDNNQSITGFQLDRYGSTEFLTKTK